MKNLHTQLLPLTGNKSQYLPGTGFKAMQIFQSAFLFKESLNLQDKIHYQNFSDQQVPDAPVSCPVSATSGPLLPPAAVYTRFITP